MEIKIEQNYKETTYSTTSFGIILKLFRVNQWTKNALVFAALIFSGELFIFESILKSIIGAVLFCLISSSIYILNDTLDAEKDLLHPTKKYRPIASGLISKRNAIIIMNLIWLIALPLSITFSIKFFIILLLYLLIQIFYCLYLKHIVIIDVLCIASGFVLRAIAGGYLLDVTISPWLIICTSLLALFLALAKRRHELLLLKENAVGHRKILEKYSTELLDQLLSLVTSSTLMAYCLYTFTSNKPQVFMLTILFVIYGLFRYQYIIFKKGLGGSPEKILISDKPILINIFLWGLTSIIVLYK
ncbi:decaprenyl-phosphate phosphoribosyltransferase [Paenibacillus cremeus]|uniref:Decaprenyl-phosphate phosphoribosyltransferase n=1 Tax=Paenibacillus cremeus TaxID=2163881 RepID=A0A559KCB6_9BACL|nr:decaprenyl-phosphate phosphoribosyltransferase [Paenibacillus cremeus]TVY09778.1 decaprenyl-phosphate phosphoribosyltransferase [Paenibacillus cremeus]